MIVMMRVRKGRIGNGSTKAAQFVVPTLTLSRNLYGTLGLRACMGYVARLGEDKKLYHRKEVSVMSERFKVTAGIDVSKDWVMVTIIECSDYLTLRTENDAKSVNNEISKRISVKPSEVLVVMEATGVYHLRLASGLQGMGYAVAVVNPFVIKKYAEMKMKRVKTDPVDSRIIAEYARDNASQIRLFKEKEEVLYEIEAKIRILDDLMKTMRSLENQRHAISYYPVEKELTSPYDEIIERIRQQIKLIEGELEEIIERNFKRQ